VHLEPWQLSATPSALDPNGTYVLYCDAGMEAVVLAEALQRRGIEAYAFRGGTRAIRKQAEEQPESA
jgi:rhodanese-related sulfurtransferase